MREAAWPAIRILRDCLRNAVRVAGSLPLHQMMADGINQWLRYIQVLAEGVNKMPEDRPRRTQKPSRKHRNKPSGWQVVAVQSISCVVVILIVLLFKMIGGSAFEQLRQSFNKSIMSNSLMATIAALLETPSEKSETGSSLRFSFDGSRRERGGR